MRRDEDDAAKSAKASATQVIGAPEGEGADLAEAAKEPASSGGDGVKAVEPEAAK